MDKGKGIIKPLAAAFLTTDPGEDETVRIPAVRKPAPRTVKQPVPKLGELTEEETRVLLREQLVSRADFKLEPDEEEDFTEIPEKRQESVKPVNVPAVEKKSAPTPAPVKPSTHSTPVSPVKAAEKSKPVAADISCEFPAARNGELFIEHGGITYSREEIIALAIRVWTKKLKRGRKDLKEVSLYIKPDEHTVYYVFNKTRKGSFEI